MTPAVMTTFFGVLTVAANAAAVVIVVGLLAGKRVWLQAQIGHAAVALAWLVATVATLGSLYYSEIASFTPCTLCWYQRIAMYPLAVVLGVAALARDPGVRRYVWPLAGVGGGLAAYHYWLEWFPTETVLCRADTISCSVVWFRELGFMSLPYMALSAFTLIAALLYVANPKDHT